MKNDQKYKKTPIAILFEIIEKYLTDLLENETDPAKIARLMLLEEKLNLLKEFLIEEF